MNASEVPCGRPCGVYEHLLTIQAQAPLAALLPYSFQLDHWANRRREQIQRFELYGVVLRRLEELTGMHPCQIQLRSQANVRVLVGGLQT